MANRDDYTGRRGTPHEGGSAGGGGRSCQPRSSGPRRLARRRIGAAVAIGTALAALVLPASPASAFTPLTTSSCDEVLWSAPPTYVVHLTEFWQLGFHNESALFAAIHEVNQEFNQSGKTTAEVVVPAGHNTASISPFEFGDFAAYDDPRPTLHIGFVDDSVGDSGLAGALTGPKTVAPDDDDPSRTTCTFDEAHIAFDAGNNDWAFKTPEDFGENYYTTGQLSLNPAGGYWFRTVYLHELLHTFGLGHEDDAYSFMNYGFLPWANRPKSEAVRPLPDDVEGLRHLYPGTGERSEIAVLNTWIDTDEVSDSGAATQVHNPGPHPQGQADSDDVCPGDTMKTRFTVANYSTRNVTGTAWLYFSVDDELSSDDLISPSNHNVAPALASAMNRRESWTVPSSVAANTDYHVIVRVTATTNVTNVHLDDWIPQVTKVHVGDVFSC